MDTTLQRLAETVTEARSLEDLTRPLLEMLEIATGFDSVYLTTIDLPAGLQHILFSRNSGELQIREGMAVPWEDTLCKRAIEEGELCTADVAARWPDSSAARVLGIRSYVAMPVRSGKQLYGTLCAASAESLSLEEDTQRLIQMFARLIGHHLEREALLEHLRRTNDELAAAVLADPLTGLASRRALLAELATRLPRATSAGIPLHVAFLDLDGFKAVNDLHGHDVGDELLRHLAERLAAATRSGDFAARYGGDEFVVLAWGSPGDDREALRRRLEEATRGRFALSCGILDYPGASVGVTTARPGEASQDLLARADEEMYQVKRRRRAPATQAEVVGIR